MKVSDRKQARQLEAPSIMIVGLPNTGKTQVFNNLTGEYGVVANYPSTTIEMHSSLAGIGSTTYTIVDTPGFHGLYIHSEEELAIREMIVESRPKLLIQCIDANRLKQSLYLTADLMELGIPMVISLNAIDETTRKGVKIDVRTLSTLLGIPVVETVATEGRGTADLKKAVEQATTGKNPVRYHKPIEEKIASVEKYLSDSVPFKRKAALLLIQHDPYIYQDDAWIPPSIDRDELRALTLDLRSTFHGNISKAVNQKRNQWVDWIVNEVVQRPGLKIEKVAEALAAISRKPITGIPILVGVLILGYLLVVHVAGALEAGLTMIMSDPLTGLVDRALPPGFLENFLIGQYGVLTLGIFTAIGTVLPVLSVFFLLFGLMEDVGYLPNLAILVKRVLNKIGLSGKSIMPLVLGFGCKTMATLTARSIPSRKEKLIAIYLIAFAIPCSAQLGLNMAILGKAGISAFLITILFLLLVEIGAGSILNRLIKNDQRTNFIQELPDFRLPNVKALLKKTYYRMVWFLKESLLIFIIAAVVLFFLDLSGVLGAMKYVLQPVVVGWLGLPIDMVDALILTMARHEVGAGIILNMSDAGMLDFTQSIIAVVITTMFIPCIANIVAMFKEIGAKAGIIMTLSINVSSFILAGALRYVLVLFGG